MVLFFNYLEMKLNFHLDVAFNTKVLEGFNANHELVFKKLMTNSK